MRLGSKVVRYGAMRRAHHNRLTVHKLWRMAAGSESWRPREALRDTPCDMHGSRCDSTASYRNAVTVSHLLKNSSLLTVDGVGHGAFFGNDCVTQYTTQYLLAGTTPEDGAVCHQEPAGMKLCCGGPVRCSA